MNALEYQAFQRHASTDGYQNRLSKAVSHIAAATDQYETPYISLSGGKDSTVLYHLAVVQCGLSLDVFYFDWGLRRVPGITEHVRALVDEYGGTLVERTSQGVTDEAAFARDEHNGMAGLLGWVRTLAAERGWDASLLGVRAEESRGRRDAYTGRPPTADLGPLPAVAPLHGLTTRDIWAYLVEHDIPYHDIYDEQGGLFDRMDHRDNRLVTVYDHQFDHHGSEALSQLHFPERTNRLKAVEQSHSVDDRST